MKKMLWALLLGVTLSCNRNAVLGIGENEMNAINEITSYYGGTCSYGVELQVYQDRTARNFRITLGESKYLDEWKDQAALAASNVAWLFYKQLGKDKNTYEHIQVELLFEKGTRQYGPASFSGSDLALVENKMPLVRKTVSLLQKRSYDSLADLIKNQEILEQDINKEQLLSMLKNTDKQRGFVCDTLTPWGFRITQNSWGYQLLDICGGLPRKAGVTECSITVGLKDKSEEIYLINYDY